MTHRSASYLLECAWIWLFIAISRFLLRQGRAGQTEFLSDPTSQACLADGHQPQGPPPFFPGGAASGRRPGLSGTRET
jgi:hypothetical protein